MFFKIKNSKMIRNDRKFLKNRQKIKIFKDGESASMFQETRHEINFNRRKQQRATKKSSDHT